MGLLLKFISTRITPPTFLLNYMRAGQVYATYFLPLHQKPSAMMPKPTQLQKNVDSRQFPIRSPKPNAISAHPQSWFFLHTKNTSRESICGRCRRIHLVESSFAGFEHFLKHRHACRSAVSAFLNCNHKGKWVAFVLQEA